MKKQDKKSLALSSTIVRNLSRDLPTAALPFIVGGYINTAKQARGCP